MIWYVTKDCERVAGIDFKKYPELWVVSNHAPLADMLQKIYPERIILSEKNEGTPELLEKYFEEIKKLDKDPEIIVFKNSSQIERFIKERGWKLLNPSAKLIEKFEHKLNQYKWLKQIKGINVPMTEIAELKKFDFEEIKKNIGTPFVLQYNLGHTGSGTKIVGNMETLEEEKAKYPDREARAVQLIKGDSLTLNACVLENEVSVGSISLQLTGISGLTDVKLATVGNDWAYITNNIKKNERENIVEVAIKIGRAMQKAGWKGLFGLDVIIETDTRDVYVIEINARQAASASFETRLRNIMKETGPLDWHLAALQGKKMMVENEKTLNASQVFLRKQNGAFAERFQNVARVGEYNESLDLIKEKALFDLQNETNLFIIPQNKTGYKPNEEILRIQMKGSFMEKMFFTAH